MTVDQTGTSAHDGEGQEGNSVRGRSILRVPKVWNLPLAIPAIVIALVTAIYVGSVIDPVDHIQELPVLVVNQDLGATTQLGHVNFGQSTVSCRLM